MSLSGKLMTTVVGSYPATPSKEHLMDSYNQGSDPFLDSIREAVLAQIDAGIDLISDGQPRTDMIRLFAGALRGFRIRERVSIINEIQRVKPITVKDQRYVKSILPEDRALKGIITGPITLVKSSEDIYYGDEHQAVADAAAALKQEVDDLTEFCDLVQIDEPILSVDLPEYTRDIINSMVKGLKTPVALHVCGDVTQIAGELVELDVNILDHEFAANPGLYDVYADLDHQKRMAVGVVTTSPEMESVDEIRARIMEAYDRFGQSCMLDPDCGLRLLKKEEAHEKLKRMVKARNMVMEEIS